MKELQEGDIIEIKKGHTVFTEVPHHFVYSDEKGNFKEFTTTDVEVDGEFDYLAGKYIVYRTALDGGGKCHNDVYPNGHHVYAEREDGTKISFYQSGCFRAMIEDIEPIGKAKRKWVEA